MKKVKTFLPMRLANDILAKRTKEDISFQVAAQQTGIAPMTLHKAECGDVPKLENFHALCVWLGKPMDAYFSKPKNKKNA